MRIKGLMTAVLLLGVQLQAVAAEVGVPLLDERVADYAMIISPSQLHLLYQISAQNEFVTKERVGLVTIASSNGMSPEQYAEQLHRNWKNDQRGMGVLLVLFKQERSAAIAVGDGLRARLSKAKVERILSGELATLVKAGSFDEAAMEGIKTVLGELGEGR